MRLKGLLSSLAVWLLLCPAAPRASADLFDAAKDFSFTSNPNGDWSYGTTGTTLNGPFTLFSNVTIGSGSSTGLNGWVGTVPMFGGEFPIVAKNTNTTTITPPNQVLLPGDLFIHPGPDGSYAVVQFTAPTAGVFSLNTVFEGRAPTNEGFPAGTTTDVHILLNGVSLFDGAVNGFGPSSDQSFATNLNLHVGDVLEFAAGFGANQNFLNDTTGLDATISSVVPEPSSFGPAAIGMTALALAGWRRSRITIFGRRVFDLE